MCARGAFPWQQSAGHAGPQRRASAAGVAGLNRAAPGLGVLETAPPPTQKRPGHQSQAHLAHLSGPGPELTPAAEKARAGPRQAALDGARGSQPVLVARLYQRRVDRRAPVSDAERARRLQSPVARRGSRFFIACCPGGAGADPLGRMPWPSRATADRQRPRIYQCPLTKCCEAQAIALHGIQPGKPTQNAYIEWVVC